MVLGKTVWFLKEAFFDLDLMSLDHAVQRFTIDPQYARCCLLVASRVCQDAGDMSSLNLSQRRPRFFLDWLGRIRRNLSARRVMEIADALRKILDPNQSITHRRRPDHCVLKLAN